MPASTDSRPETDFTAALLCLVMTQIVQYFIDNQTCPVARRARPSVPNLAQV